MSTLFIGFVDGSFGRLKYSNLKVIDIPEESSDIVNGFFYP